MSEIEYPIGLLYRLLSSWEMLAYGRWPADQRLPEGYRGQRSQDAPFVHAIIARADIQRAVATLPAGRRTLAQDWLRRGDGTPPHWLVEAVWERVNALLNR